MDNTAIYTVSTLVEATFSAEALHGVAPEKLVGHPARIDGKDCGIIIRCARLPGRRDTIDFAVRLTEDEFARFKAAVAKDLFFTVAIPGRRNVRNRAGR